MKELIVDAIVENIEKVTDFVNLELEAMNCSFKIQTQIDVVIDELFSNIAYYAYGEEKGQAIVRIDISKSPAAIVLTFADHGIPYNPLEAEEPDITLNAEDRQVGGLGIFIVKKMVDEISYEYRDKMNILTVKKKLK